MHVPNQVPPSRVKISTAQYLSSMSFKILLPSQRTPRPIPSPIAIGLRELGKQIVDFDGNFQCAASIYAVLDTYEKCLVTPGNTEKGCALSAARFIAGPLCDTYCSSLCKLV
jgi:hypothetical protein